MRIAGSGNQGTINIYAAGYKANRYYCQDMIRGVNLSNRAITANTIYASPFYVGRSSKIDRLATYIASAVASAKARVGIYESQKDLVFPGALLVQSQELDCSTIGAKESWADFRFKGGKVYWLAFLSDSAVSPRIVSQPGWFLGVHKVEDSITPETIDYVYGSQSYGSLPATFPTITDFGSASTNGEGGPVVFFRVPPSGIGGNDLYVKSLLHFNGSDASTWFQDVAAGSYHDWTANGNAIISTGANKFNQTGLFDGTGDFIRTPYHSDFDLGSGNFTWEIWGRWTTLPTAGNNQALITVGRIANDNNVNSLFLNNTGGSYRLNFLAKVNGSTIANYYQTSGWGLSTGTYYHIALVRSGTTIYLFVDGSLQTITEATAIGSNSITLAVNEATTIGAYGDGGSYHNGRFDEFRFSKGVARWTSGFTAPTAEYY